MKYPLVVCENYHVVPTHLYLLRSRRGHGLTLNPSFGIIATTPRFIISNGHFEKHFHSFRRNQGKGCATETQVSFYQLKAIWAKTWQTRLSCSNIQ